MRGAAGMAFNMPFKVIYHGAPHGRPSYLSQATSSPCNTLHQLPHTERRFGSKIRASPRGAGRSLGEGGAWQDEDMSCFGGHMA